MAVSSAIFLLILVLAFSDLIAIIPIPAMAAVIMIVGANMINWQDIRPHFSNWPEAIIFLTAFISVHIFGLFGAVIVGSLLALIHFKWSNIRPDITFKENVLTIYGSLYYGSLPYIESAITKASESGAKFEIDLRNITYMDAEGERWLREMLQNKENKILLSQ